MTSEFTTPFGADDSDPLAAYWDALAAGDPNPPTAGLDSETIALLRRIQRASRSGVPGNGRERALNAAMLELPGYRARANGHMRSNNMIVTPLNTVHDPGTPAIRRDFLRPGKSGARHRSGGVDARFVGFFTVAAVVLLLIALTGDYGALQSRVPGWGNAPTRVVPAVQVPSESTPSSDVPTVDIVIPAEYLPTGKISVTTWEFNQLAGTSDVFTDLPTGVSMEIVSAGSYAVVSDGPRLIWRAGSSGPPEEIAPGGESIVSAGDIIVYLDNAPQTSTVLGDTSVSSFNIAFNGPDGRDSEIGGATGDAIVAVRRITLEPGESISVPGATPVERFVETGTLTYNVVRPGQSTPQAGVTFTAIVPHISFAAGTTVVLSNQGDVPVVFIEAAITLPPEAD